MSAKRFHSKKTFLPLLCDEKENQYPLVVRYWVFVLSSVSVIPLGRYSTDILLFLYHLAFPTCLFVYFYLYNTVF